MGFAFAETMAGYLELASDPRSGPSSGPFSGPGAGAADARHPFHFRVQATAPSTWRHLQDGKAQLSGVVHAPPLCEAADLQGSLVIRVLGARVIRYQLWFLDDAGRRLTFAGQKNLSLLALRRTFTELDGELRDDQGALVARAHVRFDLRRDWLSFLRSFHRVK